MADHRIRELDLTGKIRMRLVPVAREVRALHEQRGNPSHEHSGSRQNGRGGTTVAARQWRIQKGEDGRRHLVETLRFSSREIQDLLRTNVTDAGWTWRGVLHKP
ncbi:hypothetical protein [Streptomyces sp. NBC_01565]|uniref:hypothetical protein n=1 Tax=Streptomyces sp. NBC_01565 TaxID=2975881 RepID=UPI00224DF2CB|nr:hypothetical protein [Streptomyces sp. NBC_01565]MCX4545179.1 hypothetical protein [Streptomyces sp. NBC_01565]